MDYAGTRFLGFRECVLVEMFWAFPHKMNHKFSKSPRFQASNCFCIIAVVQLLLYHCRFPGTRDFKQRARPLLAPCLVVFCPSSAAARLAACLLAVLLAVLLALLQVSRRCDLGSSRCSQREADIQFALLGRFSRAVSTFPNL